LGETNKTCKDPLWFLASRKTALWQTAFW
jgi:hypothetical protein